MPEGKYIKEYKVLNEIKRGIGSNIYLAQDKIGQQVVLKEFLYDSNSNINREEQRARFLREIDIHLSLHHSNIINSLKSFEHENNLFLVLAYYKEQTLKEKIDRESPLDLVKSVDIISQLCTVVQFLHDQYIIHRDIKPSNILLCDNNKPMLTDFGCAKYVNLPGVTQARMQIGTPNYMSPEQILGEQDIDSRSDIFSLGIILYHMLTGQLPFEASCNADTDYNILYKSQIPARNLNPYIPLNLETIIHKALHKDRDYRFLSAKRMAEALKKILKEPEIYFNEAKMKEKRKDKDNAQKLYYMAINCDERHLPSWQALGELYLLQKNLLNAKDCFIRVIKLDPSKADIEFQLGNINYELGLYDEALKRYYNAWTRKPSKEFSIKISYVYLALNKYEEAIEHYKNMLRDHPDCSNWQQYYYEMGKTYYNYYFENKNKYEIKDVALLDLALENFKTANELNPNNCDILYNLGCVYQELNDLTTSISIYQRVLTLNHDCPEAKHNLAYVYLQRGEVHDLQLAQKHLVELLGTNPSHAKSHIVLAYVFEKLELSKFAINEFEIALALEPHNVESYLKLAAAYRKKFRVEEAIKVIEKATLEINKPNIELLRVLASLYAEKGQYEIAIKTYEICLKCPDNPELKQVIEEELNKLQDKVKLSDHSKITNKTLKKPFEMPSLQSLQSKRAKTKSLTLNKVRQSSNDLKTRRFLIFKDKTKITF